MECLRRNFNNNAVIAIFVTLMIDLTCLNIIQPIFPDVIENFMKMDRNGIHTKFFDLLRPLQQYLKINDSRNNILFVGMLVALFNFTQFLSSPIITALSDKFGRKPFLLFTMTGIMASFALWVNADTMILFIISRMIAGAGKTNISLCIATVIDTTNRFNRPMLMSYVGIAFAVGSIAGPLIGAIFSHNSLYHGEWFPYPASTATCLTLMNIVFCILFLTETLPCAKLAGLFASLAECKQYLYLKNLFCFTAVRKIKQKDLIEVKSLGFVYFFYLSVFSGLEIPLIYMFKERFDFSAIILGCYLSGLGLSVSFMQFFIFNVIPKEKMTSAISVGLTTMLTSYICLGLASTYSMLYLGLFLYAAAQAISASCITTLTANYGAAVMNATVMIVFRSIGNLARVCGPIVISLMYWWIGSRAAFFFGAFIMLVPLYSIQNTFPD